MTTTIATATTVGTHLFGGESNQYYSERSQRLLVVEIQKNVDNLFRVVVYRARWIPSMNSAAKDGVVFDSGVIASESEAREIANEVFILGRDKFTGNLPPLEKNSEGIVVEVPDPNLVYGFMMPNSKSTSVCPKCDTFNSLVTKQEAYGDSTTCKTTNCDYNSWYSIGD